jgi:hypothetical protein
VFTGHVTTWLTGLRWVLVELLGREGVDALLRVAGVVSWLRNCEDGEATASGLSLLV